MTVRMRSRLPLWAAKNSSKASPSDIRAPASFHFPTRDATSNMSGDNARSL